MNERKRKRKKRLRKGGGESRSILQRSVFSLGRDSAVLAAVGITFHHQRARIDR